VLQNVIRMIMSRNIRWEGHAESMASRGRHKSFEGKATLGKLRRGQEGNIKY
jgi:hypothetical protein